MGLNRKPSTDESAFSTAEEAYHALGPVGRVPPGAFADRLHDPDVRETLAAARRLWQDLYGCDHPVDIRSE